MSGSEVWRFSIMAPSWNAVGLLFRPKRRRPAFPDLIWSVQIKSNGSD
jgi:hypothetical protein